MQPDDQARFIKSFESIYDQHGATLFGIALKISPTEIDAEEIFVATFNKIKRQDIVQKTSSWLCLSLIKILVQTSHEILQTGKLEGTLKPDKLETNSLLFKILCEQISLQSICAENNITRLEVGKIISRPSKSRF